MIKELPEDYRIIPGHGVLATKDDLRTFQAMRVETTGIIRKGIVEGKTINQLKAAGMPAKYKSWGSGFINTDRWISIVYNGLAASN
ncbi:MAG: cyclase [Candidatus Binatia bacterium]|jgi:cyclase